MRKLISLSVAALGALAAGGCAVKYTEPTTQPAPLSAAEKDFDAVWQASRQTLTSYGFELDRQDRRAGVIETRAMTGMHFSEVWRKDAPRPIDVGESTVQTIYRTARVTVRPTAPEAARYKAQVEVFLERSNRPTPLVTSTSDAYGLFRVSGDAAPGRAADDSEGEAAVTTELGSDRALEAKLTAAIAKAAEKRRGS
jgi:hypothetical protein